jgi:hypothetical protein
MLGGCGTASSTSSSASAPILSLSHVGNDSTSTFEIPTTGTTVARWAYNCGHIFGHFKADLLDAAGDSSQIASNTGRKATGSKDLSQTVGPGYHIAVDSTCRWRILVGPDAPRRPLAYPAPLYVTPTPIPPTATPAPTDTPIPTDAPTPPWYPQGYQLYFKDPSIAWKWDNSVSKCQDAYSVQGEYCWGMRVVTENGCQSSIYAEVNILQGQTVIDYSNDTLAALAPGQVGELAFKAFENTSSELQAQLNQINCY